MPKVFCISSEKSIENALSFIAILIKKSIEKA